MQEIKSEKTNKTDKKQCTFNSVIQKYSRKEDGNNIRKKQCFLPTKPGYLFWITSIWIQ